MKPPEIHYVDTPLWVWRLIQVCLFLPALVLCPVFPSALVAIWNAGRRWKDERDRVIWWADSSRRWVELCTSGPSEAPIQTVVAASAKVAEQMIDRIKNPQGIKGPDDVPERIEIKEQPIGTLCAWADLFPEPIRSRIRTFPTPFLRERVYSTPLELINDIYFYSPTSEAKYWEKVYRSIIYPAQ